MDLVYLWLDGGDPVWQKEYKAQMSSRSRSNDELFFSIYSWTQSAKWHRGRIVIVSPNQRPKWLDRKEPWPHLEGREVVIVDQRDLLPGRVKIRNNFLIEANLHRIPDVTEQFVYVNDDYFWGPGVELPIDT